MTHRFWGDLTARDITTLDSESAVAVLPVAAIEQHGPHLPLCTDAAIADGMIGEASRRVPHEVDALFLPIQAIGASLEHMSVPGTLSLSADAALRVWVEIGRCVAKAGIGKLVIVTSHGGNSELIGLLARQLRAECAMLVAHCAWSRFGAPPDLFSAEELAHGIHGGEIETSLMLHFRPDLVRMELVRDFTPVSIAMTEEFALLRPTGPIGFGWIAGDLHPEGVAGNAARATADKGRALAVHQAEGFARLLLDLRRFSLDRLAKS